MAYELLTSRDLLVQQRTNQGRVLNPLWRIVRDSGSDYVRLCEQFGVTPSSRARFDLPEPNLWDIEEAVESWKAERSGDFPDNA